MVYKKMRLAINGYGRIGRCVLRAASLREDCRQIDVVVINELASSESIAYLTRYDSTHGRFPGQVELNGSALGVSGQQASYNVEILSLERLAENCWSQRNIDILLDCSGKYGVRKKAQEHIDAGAAKVLLSYPGAATIPAIVYGVNHCQIKDEHPIISAASCTSNALAPVLSELDAAFGIRNGVVTTIHASMHDQPVIDAYHSDDLRKNRAASQSIIPVDTALAAGVARVIPSLENKLIAHAIRVPVSNVSALNVTVELAGEVTAEAVNNRLESAAQGALTGILGFSREKLASCDFIGDTRSAIVDSLQTGVVGNKTVNLLIWFDNEWAFANRMLDIALMMTKHSD